MGRKGLERVFFEFLICDEKVVQGVVELFMYLILVINDILIIQNVLMKDSFNLFMFQSKDVVIDVGDKYVG